MLVRLKSLVQGKAGHGHVLPTAIGALIKARNHLSKKPETLTIAPTVPVAKSMPKKPPKAVTKHTQVNISIPPPMPDNTSVDTSQKRQGAKDISSEAHNQFVHVQARIAVLK